MIRKNVCSVSDVHNDTFGGYAHGSLLVFLDQEPLFCACSLPERQQWQQFYWPWPWAWVLSAKPVSFSICRQDNGVSLFLFAFQMTFNVQKYWNMQQIEPATKAHKILLARVRTSLQAISMIRSSIEISFLDLHLTMVFLMIVLAGHCSQLCRISSW